MQRNGAGELEIRETRKKMESDLKSQTPPIPSSSVSHSFSSLSSSSSDFEFSICTVSPRKSSTADELFYKGQLLPLHLPPRTTMVRSLIPSSFSSTSSTSYSTDTPSRESTGSLSSSKSDDSQYSINSDIFSFFPGCDDSSRPSSVTEDDEFTRFHYSAAFPRTGQTPTKKSSKYLPLFRKEVGKKGGLELASVRGSGWPAKWMSGTVRAITRKYLRKVKPLCQKLQSTQQKQRREIMNIGGGFCSDSDMSSSERSMGVQSYSREGWITWIRNAGVVTGFSKSSSGNLKWPRKTSCVSSCPSSIMSSPSRSRVHITGTGFSGVGVSRADSWSMEELQSAIQGAIAHCKNSLLENKAVNNALE